MANSNNFSTLPLHLWEQKTKDPWLLIAAYFDYADKEDTFPLLEKLFTASMDKEYRPVERNPGNLCFFAERLESLIYAAHLLLHKPKALDESASRDMEVAQNFFQYKSWPQWRLQLYQLLQFALLNSSICEELNPAQLPVIQQQLGNLVTALHNLWLIRIHPVLGQLNAAVRELYQHLSALLQPQLVYAVAANGTGYTSLLFILPDSNTHPYKEFDELLQLAAINYPMVSISLHKYATIAQRIQEGHLFYSRVCTPAQLLHDGGGDPLPVQDSNKLTAMLQAAAAVFEKEFEMAARFLVNAQTAITQKDFKGAAFMLHQSAELCLRSLYMAYMGRELRSHSIQCLLQHTVRFAPSFAVLFPHDDALCQPLLQLLDEAYSGARYDTTFSFTAVQATTLYKKIAGMHQLAKRQFLE